MKFFGRLLTYYNEESQIVFSIESMLIKLRFTIISYHRNLIPSILYHGIQYQSKLVPKNKINFRRNLIPCQLNTVAI